jgi:hypothetical protein
VPSDGLISRGNFITITKRFVAAFTQVSGRHDLDALNASCERYLHALFSSFDRTGSDVADAAELACGLAIMCSGLV